MLKRFVKRLGRPFIRPLMARVDARVASSREEVERARSELALIRDDLDAIRQHFGPLMARVQTHDRLTGDHAEALGELKVISEHLPALLNMISSQNAAVREARRTELELRQGMAGLNEGRAALESRLADESAHLHKRLDEVGAMLSERIGQVERRSEFIRQETLFEARYGGHGKGVDAAPEPRIVSESKLAEFGDDIRLNLGCGHIPIEGYLNVDARPLDGVDVVAEVGDLPFEPGTLSAIHSAHLLEHFPVEELRRRLLPYWFQMLRPGGEFTAVVPDAETMINEFNAGRFSFDDLRTVTFGDQEYDGDFHFNMFSKSSLCSLLEEAGFTQVRVVDSGRRNGICFEMEVAAAVGGR